jgi:hypothetical protein
VPSGGGGAGGVYDAGGGSPDGPLLAGALIGHRDGIVGSWHPPERVTVDFDKQNFFAIDDYRQLWRWEPWVRATVFDFELLSNLRFWIQNEGSKSLAYPQLSHRPAKGGAEIDIVSLHRPDKDVFAKQAEWLDFYADLRDDRSAEILCQMGPQVAFWSMLIYLHPSRTPKTIELLDTAVRLAIFVEIRFKHAIAAPRALEYSQQVQPMIQTPGHGSLPSGHSTQAFIIAVVLCALFKQGRHTVYYQQAMRQAYRVAVNRTVAGVHFPVDSIAGHVLGTALGEYFVARCTRNLRKPKGSAKRDPLRDGKITSREFKGHVLSAKSPDGNPDFDYHEPLSDDDVDAYAKAHKMSKAAVLAKFPFLGWKKPGAQSVDGSSILSWLWNQAESEWNGDALANTAF